MADKKEKIFVCRMLDSGNRQSVEFLMITFLSACERQGIQKRKNIRLPCA